MLLRLQNTPHPYGHFPGVFSNFTCFYKFYMVSFILEFTAMCLELNKWLPLLNISVNENFMKL